MNAMKKVVKGLFCIFAALVAGVAGAATIAVGPGDDLKAKVEAAASEDVVEVAEGTYTIGGEVTVPTGVTVTVGNVTAARTDSRVSTCVEQSWARADAKIGDWKDGCVTAVNGGVTYRVYGPKDAIHGEIAERKGDWQVVNTERPSEPCSGRVFQLWIDHGKAPQGASVRYEICPTITCLNASRLCDAQ